MTYRLYQGNLYIKRPTGWHIVGLQQPEPQTVGSWSIKPIDRDLARKVLREGKPCEPPWRGRRTES